MSEADLLDKLREYIEEKGAHWTCTQHSPRHLSIIDGFCELSMTAGLVASTMHLGFQVLHPDHSWTYIQGKLHHNLHRQSCACFRQAASQQGRRSSCNDSVLSDNSQPPV